MQLDDDAKPRAKNENRQRKNPPLLVREDGVLVPNTKLVAMKPNFRPYYGPTKPAPSREELAAYYKGQATSTRRKVIYEPQEAFDLGKADAAAIVAFAFDEYGVVLDGAKPLNELRKQVYELSQMTEAQLAAFGSQQDAPHDEDEPPAGIGDIESEPAPARRGPGRPRRNATAEA